ncbi:MAG: hypothetical protein ACKORJ_09875 [Bacteroidota bacterium]
MLSAQLADGPGVALGKSLFTSARSGSQQLFNGQEVILYSPIGDEHPYFLTADLIFGKLRYDGVWHEEVALHYDLEKQALITPYYYEGTPMQMVSAFVDGFELEGHRFVNARNPGDRGLSKAGLYEVLYEGATPVYARHRKIFHEKYRDTEVIREFEEVTEYHLIHNNQNVKITSVRELPSVFIDRKQEIKTFIRKNRNAGPARVAEFYDNLVKK